METSSNKITVQLQHNFDSSRSSDPNKSLTFKVHYKYSTLPDIDLASLVGRICSGEGADDKLTSINAAVVLATPCAKEELTATRPKRRHGQQTILRASTPSSLYLLTHNAVCKGVDDHSSHYSCSSKSAMNDAVRVAELRRAEIRNL